MRAGPGSPQFEQEQLIGRRTIEGDDRQTSSLEDSSHGQEQRE